jgi:tRNA 2-thiouridine synthesizing protein A
MPQTELDCKGMRCPMPIVKISLAMKHLQAGDRLAVEATDPAFHPDLVAWTRQLGHTLVEFQAGAVQRAVVVKGDRLVC